MSGVGDLRRDVVILACAISAGIHGALVPEHLGESVAAGGGFVAAAVALALAALLIARDGASVVYPAAAATVLGGLVVSYVFATTTGVPVLQPEPESVDALALATKAIELVGIAAAASIVLRGVRELRPSRPIPLFLAGLVAVFSALVALAASDGHAHHAHHEHDHSAAHSELTIR